MVQTQATFPAVQAQQAGAAGVRALLEQRGVQVSSRDGLRSGSRTAVLCCAVLCCADLSGNPLTSVVCSWPDSLPHRP